ncbi:uncharacterized protein AB675_3431 [Cyphellophora attinorum]|uniref:thioredoxin-dependent peroxiredoxin n=1 Tax=Cyphellophora attinorum TaxID=1664694 RepID=A0A0N0NLX6_9EURO|nr:uncharacterized protein AB675_3431 [Phialophora attinorum]KPI39549.1 hypothetical protein AB675_3431 [Phialophora attinorum]
MALRQDLSSLYAHIHKTAPSHVSEAFKSSDRDMKAAFNRDKAVKAGDKLPDFALHDGTGKTWKREDLLNKNGLLLSLNRGGWCPFCNIELRGWQKILPQLHEKGVTLVSISPDAPEESLSRREKMGLDFLVLSDPDNEVARKLGCISTQSEGMRPFLESQDTAWKDKSLDVPIPATILVDGEGVVRETFVNPEYHHRLEPTEGLKWIEKLQKP